MFKLIDKISLPMLAIVVVLLGTAPLGSEPHLITKSKMLMDGTLSNPIDVFDLIMHATPLVLLIIKLLRLSTKGKE